METSTKTVKTRLTKDSPVVETSLILDFTGATREQLITMAIPSLIIDWQAVQRTAGAIPKADTIKVVEFLSRPKGGGGFKVTPENMAARVQKMDKEDYTKTLTNLGLDEKTVQKMVKQKFPE